MEEKGQASPSGKCDKVRLVIGIVIVIILFIIALYTHRNLVTGITALIAGIIIGMFLGEKCALKKCKV
jgi:MFS-type transporter involved in bile tolerance (Atg22 family)